MPLQFLLSLDRVQSNKIKLSSQPRKLSLSSGGEIAVVACQKSVTVFLHGKQAFSENIDYEASCVAVAPVAKLAAVGSQVIRIVIFYVMNFV